MSSITAAAETTCLVIDPHPLICDAVCALVEEEHSMRVVGQLWSGEGTMESLRRLRPDVALVNATLQHPLDGFEATEQARAEGLPTQIVIYTDHDSNEQMRRAFDMGARGYVSKLSPAQTVLGSLHSVAAGRRYVDPAFAIQLIAPTGPLLSTRERDVLERLATGMQNTGIAFELQVSVETVKTHIARLFGKLHVQNRAGAVAEGFRTGILV